MAEKEKLTKRGEKLVTAVSAPQFYVDLHIHVAVFGRHFAENVSHLKQQVHGGET